MREQWQNLIKSNTKLGTNRIKCPACSGQRKKKNERSLSATVYVDRIVYQCHHCELNGAFSTNSSTPYQFDLERFKKMSIPKMKTNDTCSYLKDRKILSKSLKKYKVYTTNKFFPSCEKEMEAIAFPYHNEEAVYAVKYRSTVDKSFVQEGTGGAQTLFGIEYINPDNKTIIICEGEIDALTLDTCGYENVLSVPNGAPQKISKGLVDASEDRKFQYVWNSIDVLNAADRIILAVDNDAPGAALREELARRCGKAKTWVVDWGECKDANDALVKHGSDAVRAKVDEPTPYPITGLYTVDEYEQQVSDIYDGGTLAGESTGIASVDELFTVATGMLTVVTGIPSSGKSEFVDQVMMNLAENAQWKFAVASFENDPSNHIIKLIEKRLRKPFFDGPSKKATKEEVKEATRFIKDHFIFMDQKDGEESTVDSILEKCRIAIQRMGIRGLVVDPYNYIDLDRKGSTETEAISRMLTKMRLFAKSNDIHIFFVAHPAKMQRENGRVPIPKGMDISGSAAWFAKCDVGVTVHRSEDAPDVSEIHCWKSRFKYIGRIGKTSLTYNKVCGVYDDISFTDDDLSALDGL